MKCSICQSEYHVKEHRLDYCTVIYYCPDCEDEINKIIHQKLIEDLRKLQPQLDAGL